MFLVCIVRVSNAHGRRNKGGGGGGGAVAPLNKLHNILLIIQSSLGV